MRGLFLIAEGGGRGSKAHYMYLNLLLCEFERLGFSKGVGGVVGGGGGVVDPLPLLVLRMS